MLVVPSFLADSGPALAVFRRALASHPIADSRSGHEISLISRIDEEATRIRVSARRGDRLDASAGRPHAVVPI